MVGLDEAGRIVLHHRLSRARVIDAGVRHGNGGVLRGASSRQDPGRTRGSRSADVAGLRATFRARRRSHRGSGNAAHHAVCGPQSEDQVNSTARRLAPVKTLIASLFLFAA